MSASTFLLILTLVTADGPRQVAVEMPDLKTCQTRAAVFLSEKNVRALSDDFREIAATCAVRPKGTKA